MIPDITLNCQHQKMLNIEISPKFAEYLPNIFIKKMLEKIINASSSEASIVNRAKIILCTTNFCSIYKITNQLNINFKTALKWINRWQAYLPKLLEIKEGQKYIKEGTKGVKEHAENRCFNLIIDCLSDSPRSGRPSQFTDEQIMKIINLASTTPKSLNISLSHWSSRSLAQQAVRLEIVSKISHDRIAFFLKKADLKPHRSRYWLNSRSRNGKDFDSRVTEICLIYRNAIQLHKEGVHVVSVDEKSGIQATERANKNLPMQPGSSEKIEHEYLRHGTQCLMGNFEVATGKIIVPMISDTRKEEDFLENIQNIIATDPEGKWIIILDQLNTHKSESLVRWIAEQIRFKGDLGSSGYHGSGILKSMVTRQEFLEIKDHRIRFQFTPKHCSWMNQIEIWFSGLSKRYLKRSSFSSENELKQGIFGYIKLFNDTLAKPFKWTYKGKVLQA